MIPAARHTKRVRFSGEFGSFRSLHHGPRESRVQVSQLTLQVFWRSLGSFTLDKSPARARGLNASCTIHSKNGCFTGVWEFELDRKEAARPVTCWDLSTGYPQVIHIREFGSLRRGPRTTAQGPRAFPHTTRALNRWFFRVNLAIWRLKTFSHTLLLAPQLR